MLAEDLLLLEVADLPVERARVDDDPPDEREDEPPLFDLDDEPPERVPPDPDDLVEELPREPARDDEPLFALDERDDDPPEDLEAPPFELVERDDPLFAPDEREDDLLFAPDERADDDPPFALPLRFDFADLVDVDPPVLDEPLFDEPDFDDDDLEVFDPLERDDEPDVLLPPLFPVDEVLVGILSSLLGFEYR
ncbi:MAG: hypothetical protein JO314_13285 [Acidobacteria bacterium]|nr:hypothetical protein [Acidobacteriota bacterium]